MYAKNNNGLTTAILKNKFISTVYNTLSQKLKGGDLNEKYYYRTKLKHE